MKKARTDVFVFLFWITAAAACAQEPLWVPETSFVHTELRDLHIDYARFSPDDKSIEVSSSVGDTTGATAIAYYFYDSKTGKDDGAVHGGVGRDKHPRYTKSFKDMGVLNTRFSDQGRFILAQTEYFFHLLDMEEKALFKFPGDRDDRAWFYQNDDTLAISNKTGFRLYSTKTGKATLDMELGYRPFIGLSKSEKYLVCCFCPDYGSLGCTTELIDLATSKRLGPFKGGCLTTFSHGDVYFANVDTTVQWGQSRFTLELRKLPSCELIATFNDTSHIAFMRGGAYALLYEQKQEKQNDPFKHGISAWDIRNRRRVWSSSAHPQTYGLFEEIVSEDKVIYIQDDAGNSRILDIASGRTLLDFQDWRTRPEIGKLDFKKMGFYFSHTSMRFVTYWPAGGRTMQVMVWKPTRAIE